MGLELEDELAADLAHASRGGVGGLTELAVVGIAAHVGKVWVVEDIEHFEAQVKLHSLGNLRVFLHPRIRIDRPRPVEEVLPRAPSHATSFVTI